MNADDEDDDDDFLFCSLITFEWEHQIYYQTETFCSQHLFFTLQCVCVATRGRRPPAVSQFDISTRKNISNKNNYSLFHVSLFVVLSFSQSELISCSCIINYSCQTFIVNEAFRQPATGSAVHWITKRQIQRKIMWVERVLIRIDRCVCQLLSVFWSLLSSVVPPHTRFSAQSVFIDIVNWIVKWFVLLWTPEHPEHRVSCCETEQWIIMSCWIDLMRKERSRRRPRGGDEEMDGAEEEEEEEEEGGRRRGGRRRGGGGGGRRRGGRRRRRRKETRRSDGVTLIQHQFSPVWEELCRTQNVPCTVKLTTCCVSNYNIKLYLCNDKVWNICKDLNHITLEQHIILGRRSKCVQISDWCEII